MTTSLPPIIQIIDDGSIDFESNDLKLLQIFIKELKEIDRALILLHLEGLTGKEISKIMNITPLSVTTKVTRIKNKLKLKFDTFKR